MTVMEAIAPHLSNETGSCPCNTRRSKLMKLIARGSMWDTEAEKVFVEAFWEVLDSLYAQEKGAHRSRWLPTADKRLEDLNDDIRRQVTQAKTRTLLRSACRTCSPRPAGRRRSAPTRPPSGD